MTHPTEYAEYLQEQIATWGRVSADRINNIRFQEYGQGGHMLLDFDVYPSSDDLMTFDHATRFYHHINVEGNFTLIDQQNNLLSAVKGTGYTWRDYDLCPEKTCFPKRCVNTQGNYKCVCYHGDAHFNGDACIETMAQTS